MRPWRDVYRQLQKLVKQEPLGNKRGWESQVARLRTELLKSMDAPLLLQLSRSSESRKAWERLFEGSESPLREKFRAGDQLKSLVGGRELQLLRAEIDRHLKKDSFPSGWAEKKTRELRLDQIPGADAFVAQQIQQETQRTQRQLKVENARLPSQWGMSVYRGEYAAHRAKVKAAEARNTPAQFHPRFEPKRKDYQFAGKRLRDLPAWYLNRLWSNQSLWKSLQAHHQTTYQALKQFMKRESTQARLRHHFADPEEGPGGTREVEGSQKWARVDEKKIDRATGEEVKTGRKLWELVEFNYIEKRVRGDFQPSLDVGESKWRGSRRPTDFEQRPEARTERWQRDLMDVARGRSGPERKALIAYEKRNREEQVYEMLWERYANPKEEAGSLADQGRVDWHRSRARSLAYEDAELGGLSQIKSLYGNQPGRLTGKAQMYDVFGGLMAAMGDREKLKTWKDEMDQSGFGEHWERDLPALSSHFRRSWNATAGVNRGS